MLADVAIPSPRTTLIELNSNSDSAMPMPGAATNTEKRQVFISYRRADATIADQLYELLRTRDVDVWYDRLIEPAADWRESVVEHIGQARVMVILLSDAALESEDLKKELAVASQEQIPILTVRIENVKPRQAFAYELAGGQWFDLFPDLRNRLPELADHLRDLVHTPNGVPRKPRVPRRGVRLTHLLQKGHGVTLLLTVMSLVQLVLYESGTDAWKKLIEAGHTPLQATGFLLAAVTIGSPLMVFSLLRAGPSLAQVPLIVVAAANTLMLFLAVIVIFRWIGTRVRRGANG